MPKVMEPDSAELHVLEALLKVAVLQVVVLQGIPFPVAEHPLRNLVRSLLQVFFPPAFLEGLEFIE